MMQNFGRSAPRDDGLVSASHCSAVTTRDKRVIPGRRALAPHPGIWTWERTLPSRTEIPDRRAQRVVRNGREPYPNSGVPGTKASNAAQNCAR
jgi:hypothetical protein